MTDPIIDRLDQIKGRADMATDGPWVAEYSKEQGNCVIPHDAHSTREAVAVTRLFHQQADAEFIAAARTDVPRMEAALRAVLDHLSQWQVPDPCEGPRDQWCPDCLRNDEIRQAIAGALGVETEGGEK